MKNKKKQLLLKNNYFTYHNVISYIIFYPTRYFNFLKQNVGIFIYSTPSYTMFVVLTTVIKIFHLN